MSDFFISELLTLSINVVKSILGIMNSSLRVKIFSFPQDNHSMKGIFYPHDKLERQYFDCLFLIFFVNLLGDFQVPDPKKVWIPNTPSPYFSSSLSTAIATSNV